MAKRDIEEPALGPGGIGENVDESLEGLRERLVGKANEAIAWYARGRRRKKRAAWLLRLFAILLVSAAGLVPILQTAGLLVDRPAIIVLAPDVTAQAAVDALAPTSRFNLGQLGYVFAALAAAIIGLDRFLGLSRGWVRYITTEMKIGRALAEFQMDWFSANSCLDQDQEERACPKRRLQLLRDFSVRVSTLVEEETQQWAADFEGALALIEKSAREAREGQRPGAIQVTIERGDDVVGEVVLYLDEQRRQSVAGASASITSVAPGPHQVRAAGRTRDGAEVSASQVVTVPAGSVVGVSLRPD